MRTSVPLRRVARVLNGGTPTPDEKNWDGDVLWATPVDLARVDGRTLNATARTLTPAGLASGSACAPRGAILMSTRAPIGYTALLQQDTAFNQGCKAIIPREGTDSRFLQYVLISQESHLKSQGSGSTFLELGNESLLACGTPVWESWEQRQIADFLDDRVARIDQIIAARQAQRDLVVERFSSHLASKVAPSARSRALKGLLNDVTSGPRGWGDRVGDKGPAFVRIANLRPLGIELNQKDLARVDAPPGAEMARATLRPGDVLLSITAVFGEVAVWREGEGAFSQHIARLRPLDVLDADWIAWILQSRSLHDQYLLYGYGGTKVGLGLDHVRNLQIPDIDAIERQGQARDLGASWDDTKQVTQALRASMTRLHEYKQSLITSAVTGELDVTAASTRIPE